MRKTSVEIYARGDENNISHNSPADVLMTKELEALLREIRYPFSSNDIQKVKKRRIVQLPPHALKHVVSRPNSVDNNPSRPNVPTLKVIDNTRTELATSPIIRTDSAGPISERKVNKSLFRTALQFVEHKIDVHNAVTYALKYPRDISLGDLFPERSETAPSRSPIRKILGAMVTGIAISGVAVGFVNPPVQNVKEGRPFADTTHFGKDFIAPYENATNQIIDIAPIPGKYK